MFAQNGLEVVKISSPLAFAHASFGKKRVRTAFQAARSTHHRPCNYNSKRHTTNTCRNVGLKLVYAQGNILVELLVKSPKRMGLRAKLVINPVTAALSLEEWQESFQLVGK
jgi:hypothetical protein